MIKMKQRNIQRMFWRILFDLETKDWLYLDES